MNQTEVMGKVVDSLRTFVMNPTAPTATSMAGAGLAKVRRGAPSAMASASGARRAASVTTPASEVTPSGLVVASRSSVEGWCGGRGSQRASSQLR